MKYELQIFFFFIFMGIIVKKMTASGWFFTILAVFSWIMVNWKKNGLTEALAVFCFLCLFAWIFFNKLNEKDPLLNRQKRSEVIKHI